MKKCEKCHIHLNTSRTTCPLCYSVLEVVDQTENYQPYPKYQIPKRPNKLAIKICLFISIITIALSLLINFLTINKETPTYWSVIVIGAVAFLWVLVFVTIISKNNIALKIILQGLAVVILLLAIEYNTNFTAGWSLIYAIPFIIIGVTLLTTILAMAIPKKAPDFLFYIIGISVIGIVPLIIVLVRNMQPKWPAIACCVYSVITIFAIIFFGGKTLKDEIVKKMHV